MIVAKEDALFLVWDDEGRIGGEGSGVFKHDTRYLKTWTWTAPGARPLALQAVHGGLRGHQSLVNRRRVQVVGLERRVAVSASGFVDRWTLHNTTLYPQTASLSLEVEGEFLDMMSRWIDPPPEPCEPVVENWSETELTLSRTSADGVRSRVSIAIGTEGDGVRREGLAWTFDLRPGARAVVELGVTVDETLAAAGSPELPDYDAWRAAFSQPVPREHRAAYDRAVDDLRMLLLTTDHGPYPAAGAPWFVALFGRDALIAAYMLLGVYPDLARSVLRLLAARRGVKHDAFTEEAPGKIMHEIRRGELSRTGRIPFGLYYGSIDATPLFLMLLGAYVDQTGDETLIDELEPAWTAAVDFIVGHEGDGLLTFDPSGSGLGVQSWKDTPDSMVHADGRLAEAPLAVVEVQAYAVEALRVASRLYDRRGEALKGEDLAARARRLAAAIHQRYWLEDLGTYAMALDKNGEPSRVLSSDAGHLLWCGVVPSDVAPGLVRTLMSPALWSGWGLRTLGATEVAYNPVSYHNGSVWPHDTAIFAGGLARYGFVAEARTVAEALFDLAGHEPLQRMPELVSGFDREPGLAPIPYTHACKPQSWSAAALPYLAKLLTTQGEAG